ncbi:hypothetical protein [Halovenus marina]|uniref:hypothetical protein n=1 Tax=Halovenus marina TaxID=3396621 RepID=UPI003F5565EC
MSELDFTVYGMKLQPGAAEEGSDPFRFCKEKEIIGVGWSLEDQEYDSIDEVYETHRQVYERRLEEGEPTGRLLEDGRMNAPLRYILKEMDVGDFVWVNENNHFALCKIESDWRVAANLSADEFDQYDERDIQHFRKVDWVDVPYALVPGYVRRKFSGRFGTLSEMDKGITEDAKQVIRSLHSQDNLESDGDLDRKEISRKINSAETTRLFDILGSEETEDIVISYLQSEGWRLIKSSTSNSQAKIECEMRKEVDGESVPGYLQVKTGSAGLEPDSYVEYATAGKMIFFVQSGIDVTYQEGMTAIDPVTIHEYMKSDYNYLPNETLLKLDFALDSPEARPS